MYLLVAVGNLGIYVIDRYTDSETFFLRLKTGRGEYS